MLPLISATLLSFLSVHSNLISKPLIKWCNRPTDAERTLIEQRNSLKQDQQKLNMVDNFAAYSKLQRRINSIDEELKELQSRKKSNSLVYQMIMTYGTKALLGMMLVALSIYFRHTPVFRLSESTDLTPFTKIISYPNDDNNVSFHFWVLCCSAAARMISLT